MNATQKASRRANLTVTDQQILEAYKRLGSVHKAGAELGISHATVHKLLKQRGVSRKNPHFSDAERDRLKRDYLRYRDEGNLATLAEQMGRTKYLICRQARALGLTDQSHNRYYHGHWKYMTDREARDLFDDFKRSLKTPEEFCEERGIGTLGLWQTLSQRWPDEWELAVESSRPEGSKYRTGRIFEYKTRDDLIGRGFYATRSNRSMTPADVIAFRHGEMLLVQCKTDRYTFMPDEWNELYDLAESVSARPILAAPDANGDPEYLLMDGHKSSVRNEPQRVSQYRIV